MRKKCFSNREEFLRYLEQFIQTVKGQNSFLTCSLKFLLYDKLEQLKSKLEKIIGIEKHAGKVRKELYLNFVSTN